jgi:hypothetical protein
MTILFVAFRSRAAGQLVDRLVDRLMNRPMDMPARAFAVRSQATHRALSAPRRPRLEMRWRLDANGRLTCAWHLVSAAVPVRSDDEETKPPSCRPPSLRSLLLPVRPAPPIHGTVAAAA